MKNSQIQTQAQGPNNTTIATITTIKLYTSGLTLICLLFSLWGCREIMPIIPPVGPPALGERKVLIEEFTGVRCVNCPDGSAEIENLQSLYGENLVAVSIHAGFFSDPYPENLYDFRTPEGTQIQSYLGEPDGYPTAVINRKKFEGESALQLGRAKWAGLIAQEANLPPVINVNAEVAFNASSRDMAITVTSVPVADINAPLFLTIMITESNIRDMQYTNDGFDPNYNHKHVLRKVLTGTTGDPIGDAFALGDNIVRTYNFNLPTDWNPVNCHVIAFVHHANGNDKEVLQVDETNIVE